MSLSQSQSLPVNYALKCKFCREVSVHSQVNYCRILIKGIPYLLYVYVITYVLKFHVILSLKYTEVQRSQTHKV